MGWPSAPGNGLQRSYEKGIRLLKINKSGIAAVLDILAIARAAGKQRMLGCMLETRHSIAVSLAIACGTGAFDFIDLDSHLLLAEEGVNPFFEQVGSRMTLPYVADTNV